MLYRYRLFGQHIAQDFLQGYGMTADPPVWEEMAGAMPLTIFVSGDVAIMLSPEFNRELTEGNPVLLLSIALRLFNFPNQARLHHHQTSLNCEALAHQAQCFFFPWQ